MTATAAAKTAEDTATLIKYEAEDVITREAGARKDFAAAVAAGAALDSFNLKPVLEVQADAQPWRHVLKHIENGADAVQALRRVREDATTTLVETAPTQSSRALTNETDRIQREALRKFLRHSRRLAG